MMEHIQYCLLTSFQTQSVDCRSFRATCFNLMVHSQRLSSKVAADCRNTFGFWSFRTLLSELMTKKVQHMIFREIAF